MAIQVIIQQCYYQSAAQQIIASVRQFGEGL
jgi:hypothetical protein